MSQRKVDEFISNTFNGILKETREYRAYELGYAAGLLEFYKTVKSELGKDRTNTLFKDLFAGNENFNTYFRKLVKLYEEENSELNNLIDNFRNVKS